MSGWTLGFVAQSLNLPVPQPDRPVAEISTDSRTLKAGSVFVPLVGESFDGHDYLEVALERGAVGVVWSRPEVPALLRDSQAAVFSVADTTLAYQAIGLAHRKACGARCIGVTGSVGKTTTKEFLAHLLSGQFRVHKSEKNFNNDIGVPLTLLATRPEHDVVVVEMGMRGPGEIARLVAAAEPEIGLITSIGTSHMERLGSREGIARAKGELVAGLPAGGRAVLPLDDSFYPLLCELSTAPVLSYGGINGEVSAERVVAESVDGTDFVYQGKPYHLSPPGRHHLHDLMGALAAGLALGADPEKMLSQVATLGNPEGRYQWSECDGARLLVDAYNSAPESLLAALTVLSGCKGRRIAVLGDMLELGDASVVAHQEAGLAAAGLGIDLLLCVGPESRHTVDAAKSHGSEAEWFADKPSLAERLKAELAPDVTVLLKASRGMALETVLNHLQESIV